MPAISRKIRERSVPFIDNRRPTEMRVGTHSVTRWAARSRLEPMPISLARTLAVPAGKMPSGTSEKTTPSAISLMVPSPPAARISSAPSAMWLRAMAPAVPGPWVGTSQVS
jgi:hypothetical protein